MKIARERGRWGLCDKKRGSAEAFRPLEANRNIFQLRNPVAHSLCQSIFIIMIFQDLVFLHDCHLLHGRKPTKEHNSDSGTLSTKTKVIRLETADI